MYLLDVCQLCFFSCFEKSMFMAVNIKTNFGTSSFLFYFCISYQVIVFVSEEAVKNSFSNVSGSFHIFFFLVINIALIRYLYHTVRFLTFSMHQEQKMRKYFVIFINIMTTYLTSSCFSIFCCCCVYQRQH